MRSRSPEDRPRRCSSIGINLPPLREIATARTGAHGIASERRDCSTGRCQAPIDVPRRDPDDYP
jgi:hypothetical protein